MTLALETTRKTCRHFETCSAPLCPQDFKTPENGLWYIEEEICILRSVPQWVKKQRRIARVLKGKNPYETGYFNFPMLNRISRVTPALTGLNPDRDEKPQLDAWFKRCPGRTKPLRKPTLVGGFKRRTPSLMGGLVSPPAGIELDHNHSEEIQK